MEREKGIEPSPIAWEAIVLPLNYSRPVETNWRIAPGSLRAQGWPLGSGALILVRTPAGPQSGMADPKADTQRLRKHKHPRFS